MRWTLTSLLALTLVAPVAAQGGPRPGAPGRGFGPGPGFGPGTGFDPAMIEQRIDLFADRLAEALDLTSDQRATFDSLREQHRAGVRSQMERMRQSGEELRALLDSEKPDATAVGQKMIALHQIRLQLQAERQSFEAEFAKILTPEQQAALHALQAMRPDGGEGHGPSGGPRRGGFGGPGFGPPQPGGRN